jgi:uncharacterized protein (DUF1330 family)
LPRSEFQATIPRRAIISKNSIKEWKMPKGYVVARAVVTNATKWGEYAAKAGEAMKQYGGKPLARGGQMTVAEGEGRARNVVIEFESFEAAKTYANSPEYAAARKLREGAGHIDIICVEGA